MSNAEEETNPYELLNVTVESTEQEIRTAYRQRSLKVHPDRNPNNPDAARKFHELNQAYELLLDPLRRLALDAKLRVKQARAERFKAYDNKRKNLVEELEERERAFKKAKVEKAKEEAARWEQAEKIKDEGRRLREEKQKQLEKELEVRKYKESRLEDVEAPVLDSTDTTIRIKYNLTEHPTLINKEVIAALLKSFGETDSETIVVSLKPPKKAPHKPPKYGTALVPFKRIGDAFAAVCASGRPERGLRGIEIGWVGGKEPQILSWLKKMGKLGTPSPGASPTTWAEETKRDAEQASLPQMQTTTSAPGSFSSFPDTFPDFSSAPPPPEPTTSVAGLDYESLTLMRMRQAEKERLEREILEQEAAE
ncbi:DnaJ-domain-containing protein, partial [Marasmius fiardii PR-910]